MRLVIAVAAFAVLSSPAAASFAISCSGPDGVSVFAPLSGGAGLSTMGATIEAAGRTWSTDLPHDDPQAITSVQSFGDHESMRFDFADTNIEANVVELRVFISKSGAMGGTLDIVDVGGWVVSCDLG